jgi:hypothetical protein
MSNAPGQDGDDQLQSLLETLELLRLERFADVEPELVRKLLRLHADGGAADAELARAVEQAVEAHLAGRNS